MSRLDKYENVRNVYRLLKEKGDIDKLKSQIRQRIILGFASLENPVPKSDCEINDQNVRLVNCLIADHMKHHGYDYSLSVFLPEIGLTSHESEEHIKNLPFSKCSISRSLWKKIASYHQDTCSFLVSILKAEADISDVLKEQKSVQTCDLDVCELDQRLKDIDKEYEAVKSADILHLKQTFEDRLEYYKREVGEQYQVKLTQQMTEFRQNELNTIKLEMEDRFQERVKEHVMRLEKEFEVRLQSLNDQEELLKEKYNLSQQREEREAFVKRQALQAELDTIQLMKTQLDQERLQIEREKKQMLKDHEKREIEIKKHENLLEIREKTLEGEIQEHVDRIRMEDEIKLLKQRKEIEIQSLQLSENQKMLEEKMKTFEQLKQDLIKQQNKFTEMEINDYDTIKTQNEVYKNEITNLQKQLKNAVVELEEQKQITASATTELGVLSVVKQEIERLMNTLNNDRVTFIQEKINLQKKLNEQQNEIHRLIERLALHDGGNIYPGQYYSSCCTGTCVTNHPRTAHQNVTKTRQLTEAERRSIYEECNLSISSDMSGESCMGVKKVQKTSDAAPLSNPQFHQWSQRLELSRRRMAQLQMVSEQFDSIYEEWKSVDLKEFLSKLNTELPNLLTTGKSDGLTNPNELFKSDQFITFENNSQADQIMHQQTVHQESEINRNLDKEHIGSHSDINPESRSMKMKSESDIDVQDNSYSSSLHDLTNGSDINTPKSNKSILKNKSNEIMNIPSRHSSVSGSNHLDVNSNRSANKHLDNQKPDSARSIESISQSQSIKLLDLKNVETSEISDQMTSSHRSGKDDHRMEVINTEHADGEMEARQSDVSDKMITNNNLDNDGRKIIEDGFPLLLETSRTECTEGENKNLATAVNLVNGKCSPSGEVEECLLQIKSPSNSNINGNGHTGNDDIMEKYLRLSLDNQSKSPVPEQNNVTVQSKLTNGFHSTSPKSNIRSWFENNHNFSSSESDISLNKTRNGHFTPLESLNNHEKIQNGDEIDSGSDYVW